MGMYVISLFSTWYMVICCDKTLGSQQVVPIWIFNIGIVFYPIHRVVIHNWCLCLCVCVCAVQSLFGLFCCSEVYILVQLSMFCLMVVLCHTHPSLTFQQGHPFLVLIFMLFILYVVPSGTCILDRRQTIGELIYFLETRHSLIYGSLCYSLLVSHCSSCSYTVFTALDRNSYRIFRTIFC